MSMGPCGPLRVPEWVWGDRDRILQPGQPRKTQSLCQTSHVSVMSLFVRLGTRSHVHVSVCICMCPCHLCASPVHVFVKTQLCVCMRLCAHPWACIHSVLVDLDQPLCFLVHPMCTSTSRFVHARLLARVTWTEHLYKSWQTFLWKGQESK